MNFKEAMDKLDKLAGERYHYAAYKVVKYSNGGGGGIEPTCSLYIDGTSMIFDALSWESAFEELEQYLDKLKHEIDPVEEITNGA